MISSLTVEKLACMRGDRKLFDGLSFRVTAGQGLIAQLMARHCGHGGIIIAATHDPLGLGNESLKL